MIQIIDLKFRDCNSAVKEITTNVEIYKNVPNPFGKQLP